MAINYTSYPAWNNAFNPWPKYNSVTLSAADIPLVTLTLTVFNPAATGGDPIARYSAAGQPVLAFDMVNYGLEEWTVWNNAAYTAGLYYQILMPRAVPSKQPGSAAGWAADTGTDVNSLYISPTRTPTQWEKRRKRILGYR
jgi:hypothetical protein